LRTNDLKLIRRSWHGLCIRVVINRIKYMKQKILTAEGFESTYALLVRSEEKERSFFEGGAYLVFILSAVFSIWQVAQQPFDLSKDGVTHTTPVTQATDTHRH
jgi:hypothetical protein